MNSTCLLHFLMARRMGQSRPSVPKRNIRLSYQQSRRRRLLTHLTMNMLSILCLQRSHRTRPGIEKGQRRLKKVASPKSESRCLRLLQLSQILQRSLNDPYLRLWVRRSQRREIEKVPKKLKRKASLKSETWCPKLRRPFLTLLRPLMSPFLRR